MKVYYSLPIYYGASPYLFKLAKEMRDAPTEAELILWQLLHVEPFKKYNFRRQHPLAEYIADFYSHPLKLVIETDGGIHLKTEQKQYENFRDEYMHGLGIAVLRFSNQQIFEDAEIVKQMIQQTIAKVEGGC